MIHETALLERTVLEGSDFNKMGLSIYARLDERYCIIQGQNKRFICEKRKNDYIVLGIYIPREVNVDLDKVRSSGL